MLLKIRKLVSNIFASFKHILPTSFRMPVSIPQIVYILMTVTYLLPGSCVIVCLNQNLSLECNLSNHSMTTGRDGCSVMVQVIIDTLLQLCFSFII